MPICRECNITFQVHENDLELLRYFDVPEPTLCGTHSLQRRLAFRNESHLYKRICELCKKDILAMYSQDSYVHVYCHNCWYGDGWDAKKYAREYDPTRSFIEQWFELMKEVPHFNLWQVGTNENCEYSNYVFSSKDCYLSSSVQSEGLLYSRNTDYSRDCVDCFNVLKSELLYDCVSTTESYSSAFLTRCEKCSNCYLGRDLQDCQQCFGCVNLKHKQYCWFNEQLSEDEYRSRVKRALETRSSFEEYRKRFEEFSQSLPVEFALIRNSENVTGNAIQQSKLIRNSYAVVGVENCSDCYRVAYGYKDVYRMSYGGIDGSLIYECLAMPHNSSCIGSISLGDSSYISYSCLCFNSNNLFGCIGMRKKEYCILNRQYAKDEYEVLKAQIIEDMKKRGEWGEFFPVKYSPFGYNDSLAYEFIPLTRDEAQFKGYIWEEHQGGTTGMETIQPEVIHSDIQDVSDSISKEILRCISCSLNYRIQRKELERLKSLSLPVPLQCQNCRFKERMNRYFFPALNHRTCMCSENHSFHVGSNCTAEFETTYRPDGKDIVYCKPCYQESVQ